MVNAFRNYRCYNGQMWAASISQPKEMTWDDRRALMEMVFNDRPSGDKRMGVYVSRSDERSRGQQVWSYPIHGRLADLRGTTSDDYDTDSGNAHLQRDVLKEVANKNASSPDELNHGPF